MKHQPRSRRRSVRRIFGTRFPLRMETLEARITPAVVTSLNDFGTGTLRQAILNANSSGGDTITFDPSLFPSGGGTVTINLNSPIQSSGQVGLTELDITSASSFRGRRRRAIRSSLTTSTRIRGCSRSKRPAA